MGTNEEIQALIDSRIPGFRQQILKLVADKYGKTVDEYTAMFPEFADFIQTYPIKSAVLRTIQGTPELAEAYASRDLAKMENFFLTRALDFVKEMVNRFLPAVSI